MQEYEVLLNQITALEEELSIAKHSLESEKIDDHLRTAVENRFLFQLQDMEEKVSVLRKEGISKKNLNVTWSVFLDTRRHCERIFMECLAFIEGALVRSAGMDNGLCQIADNLLYELNHEADLSWNRFTIMAEGEYIANLSGIIRLRYPKFNIWNLPITAHEFGHYALDQQKELMQYTLKINPNLLNNEKERNYLHEQFADLFATYCLGPAFACTAILLYFNPFDADKDGNNHPSNAKRVELILLTLEKMNQSLMTKPYSWIISELRKQWSQNRQVIGKPASLPQIEVEQLKIPTEAFYDQIMKRRFNNIFYGSENYIRASLLSNKFVDSTPIESIIANVDYLTQRDILNAAWLARLNNGENNIRQISEKAKNLSEQIL